MLKETGKLAHINNSKGFTLIEMALVVAVMATLGLSVFPIVQDKVSTAKAVAAESDLKNLGTAIATFYQDTGEFPTRNGAEKNEIEVLRSGSDSSLDPKFAQGIGNLWGLTEVDELNNHLLIDNPGGTARGYENNNAEWRGPYLGDIGQDPWGRNYLVIAKGFYDAGTDTSPVYAWIISGGPNETIETDIDSQTLNSDTATGVSTKNDDIGFLIFTSE